MTALLRYIMHLSKRWGEHCHPSLEEEFASATMAAAWRLDLGLSGPRAPPAGPSPREGGPLPSHHARAECADAPGHAKCEGDA